MAINGLHIDMFGTKFWYKNSLIHREDGPAVEYTNGKKLWYQNGMLHRIDGPAIEYNNDKKWFKNDKYHREDGPAVEMNSIGVYQWWYNGENVICNSTEEFIRLLKLKVFW